MHLTQAGDNLKHVTIDRAPSEEFTATLPFQEVTYQSKSQSIGQKASQPVSQTASQSVGESVGHTAQE